MTGRVHQIFQRPFILVVSLAALIAVPVLATTMEKETLPVNGRAPVVTGVTFDSLAMPGATVTASPIFSDADGDHVDFLYQWQLDGNPILNATNPSYAINAGEALGRKLGVLVTPMTDAALTEPFKGVEFTSPEIITRYGPPDSGTSTMDVSNNGIVYSGAPLDSDVTIALKDMVGNPAEFTGSVALDSSVAGVAITPVQGCVGPSSVCQMTLKADQNVSPVVTPLVATVNGLPVGNAGLSKDIDIRTVQFDHTTAPDYSVNGNPQPLQLSVEDNQGNKVSGVEVSLSVPSFPLEILKSDANGYINYFPPKKSGFKGEVPLTATLLAYSQDVHKTQLKYVLQPYPGVTGIAPDPSIGLKSVFMNHGTLTFEFDKNSKSGDVRNLLVGGNGAPYKFYVWQEPLAPDYTGVGSNGMYACNGITNTGVRFNAEQFAYGEYEGSGRILIELYCN